MRNYVMEFIGTMFWVMAAGMTGDPLAIGLMIMVMVYMGAHVSGAHYNPAVTISVWIRAKLPRKQVLGYMAAQVAGAIVAALICYYFNEETFAPAPGLNVSFAKAFLAELMFTFALVSVVLNVTTTKRLEGNCAYGLAIGFTLVASAYTVGGLSGGVFNPAVGVGAILVDALFGGGSMANLLLYIVGPGFGGALAAAIFPYLNPDEFK